MNCHNTVCFRFVKSKPLRVIESLIVATMSSCVAFSLIYFYDDCRPLGNFNMTQTLQVRYLKILKIMINNILSGQQGRYIVFYYLFYIEKVTLRKLIPFTGNLYFKSELETALELFKISNSFLILKNQKSISSFIVLLSRWSIQRDGDIGFQYTREVC